MMNNFWGLACGERIERWMASSFFPTSCIFLIKCSQVKDDLINSSFVLFSLRHHPGPVVPWVPASLPSAHVHGFYRVAGGP